jgi:hypothetical protein
MKDFDIDDLLLMEATSAGFDPDNQFGYDNLLDEPITIGS